MTAGPELPIRVCDLRKSFGANEVLRGVNLELRPSENLVVLGKSGTGKSVLIKVVVGLLEPDAGWVEVFGQRVDELAGRALDAMRTRVGFSFQSGALYDSMRVRENLAFPLRINRPELSEGEVDDRVVSALEGVGLIEALDQMPAELSGGQRKRVGIARTLILEPEVMLYDEPTAGLDPVTAGEINELIVDVRERTGAASIIITHDLTSARRTGDRVALLVEGVVHRTGPFDEVFDTDDPKVRPFYDYNFVRGDAA